MIDNSTKAIKLHESSKKQSLFDRFSFWFYDNYKYKLIGVIWYDYILYPIRSFIAGIKNFKRWYKIIWKDRNYDSSYILTILKHKLIFQRDHLVKEDLNTDIDFTSRDMTLCIKLIDLINDDFYEMEKYDYQDTSMEFIKNEDDENFQVLFNTKWENLDDYLIKYPAAIRRVKKIYPDRDLNDKDNLSFFVGRYNQYRANKLLYRILEEKLDGWWS